MKLLSKLDLEQALTNKFFNAAFSYNIDQLSEYNLHDGKHFFNVGFKSLSNTISELKLKYEMNLKFNFSYLELTLEKIKVLGQQNNGANIDELLIYKDYLKLKILELLEEIEGVRYVLTNTK